jgi:hypothetical protein
MVCGTCAEGEEVRTLLEGGGEVTIDEENQKLKNALTLAVNGMTLVLKVKSSWDKMMIIKNTLACIQETTKGIED